MPVEGNDDLEPRSISLGAPQGGLGHLGAALYEKKTQLWFAQHKSFDEDINMPPQIRVNELQLPPLAKPSTKRAV